MLGQMPLNQLDDLNYNMGHPRGLCSVRCREERRGLWKGKKWGEGVAERERDRDRDREGAKGKATDGGRRNAGKGLSVTLLVAGGAKAGGGDQRTTRPVKQIITSLLCNLLWYLASSPSIPLDISSRISSEDLKVTNCSFKLFRPTPTLRSPNFLKI